MTDTPNPPDDADLQILESLRSDLRTAAERAAASGAKPVDVITCFGMALGGLIHRMASPPPSSAVAAMMGRIIDAGRQEEAERLVGAGLQHKIYGGEARRRRAR